jgi:cytochrome P450
VLLHVITNPLVYARLKEELHLAAARELISSPATELEIKQLPYLQACIKEGLRVYPPVVALRDRLVPEGGDTLRGTFVPGGTNIGLNLPAALRDEVFGSDPAVFRPERWLDADAEQLQRMERVHELVFNYGFTRCLGVRLATTMIGKFFVEALRRWDIVSTRPRQPWRSHEHGIPYQQDFYVRITEAERRESMWFDPVRSMTPPGTPPLQ